MLVRVSRIEPSRVLAETAAVPETVLVMVARSGSWPHRESEAEVILAPARPLLTLGSLDAGWARLVPGDHERRFHVRASRLGSKGRHAPYRSDHVDTIALSPDPCDSVTKVQRAPISIAEAEHFFGRLAVVECCEALGTRAAAAYDALGQPTHELKRVAALRRQPPRRRPAWRLRGRAHSDRSHLRIETLLVKLLLGDIGGERWYAYPERLGIVTHALPPTHWSDWTRIQCAAIGELAWRLAVDRDCRLGATPPTDHPLHVEPDVVG